MPPSSTPVDRPTSVVVAFWCWVVAAVLTAAQGLWVGTQSGMPTFYRAAAVLVVVVGLAQGYLAGRARAGQLRFANAALGLALASVVFLAVLLLFGGGGVITVGVIIVLLIVGAVFSRRPSSLQWFESRAAQ